MKPYVYADNAATTSLSPAALEAMLPILKKNYGNPSSLHLAGQEAKAALEAARRKTADCLGAAPREILFTSGGTESDNWAIRAAAKAGLARGKSHIVTTAFEHPAVWNTCKALEREGFSVTYLDVHENGVICPEDVANAITEQTALVSVMWVNNELGAVQPVEEIGRLCRERGVLFHTDAVQAAGKLPIDLGKTEIDLLSLSAHKFHGPKGVGALYIRAGLDLPGLMQGGAQERGKRPGTENVAGAAGLAAALEEACRAMEANREKLRALGEKLETGLLRIPGAHLNGGLAERLPGLVHLRFEGLSGEAWLLAMDLRGVAVSAGSACSSGSLEPSRTLLALGLSEEQAKSALRISLGDENTEAEVDAILAAVTELVGQFGMRN